VVIASSIAFHYCTQKRATLKNATISNSSRPSIISSHIFLYSHSIASRFTRHNRPNERKTNPVEQTKRRTQHDPTRKREPPRSPKAAREKIEFPRKMLVSPAGRRTAK
jgi:hypothetical protein